MAAANEFRLFAAGVIVCGTPPIVSVKVELVLMLWLDGSVTVGRLLALMELVDEPGSVTKIVYVAGSAPASVLAADYGLVRNRGRHQILTRRIQI